jgi:hypothetical protein
VIWVSVGVVDAGNCGEGIDEERVWGDEEAEHEGRDEASHCTDVVGFAVSKV